MKIYQVVVQKEAPDTQFGLMLSQKTGSSHIVIKGIAESGAFAQTDLVPGLQVLEINLQGLSGKSVQDAVNILKEAPVGEIMVVARGLVATAKKQSADTKVGIAIQRKELHEGAGPSEMIIQNISDDSIFANSGLRVGQKISSINGVPCPSKSSKAIQIIRAAASELTIVALESESEAKMDSEPKQEQAPPTEDEVIVNVDGEKEAKEAYASKNSLPPPISTTAVDTEQSPPSGFKAIKVTRTNQRKGDAPWELSLGMTQNFIYVHSITPTSPFADSDLRAGHRVTKINGTLCPVSLKDAMSLVSGDNGSLTLDVLEKLTENETASVPRDFPMTPRDQFNEIKATITHKVEGEDALGLTLGMTQNYIFVNSILADSPFANTDLCVGHRIVKIDEEPCPLSLKDTMTLLSQHVGSLTIHALEKKVAEDQISASVIKKDLETPFGLQVAKSMQGHLVISKIDPNGLFASSELKVGQVIEAINGSACKGDNFSIMMRFAALTGKVTIVASSCVALVKKPDIDSRSGISLIKCDDGSVIVEKIISNGLFGKTNLKAGQKIISIAGIKCPTDHNEAIGLIQDTVGELKIVAIDTFETNKVGDSASDDGRVTESAIKSTKNSKVGISLGKKNNCVIIHNIDGGGLFTNSKLRAGQKMVSIQGKPCPSTVKESILMIKEAVGTLTIVAADI